MELNNYILKERRKERKKVEEKNMKMVAMGRNEKKLGEKANGGGMYITSQVIRKMRQVGGEEAQSLCHCGRYRTSGGDKWRILEWG